MRSLCWLGLDRVTIAFASGAVVSMAPTTTTSDPVGSRVGSAVWLSVTAGNGHFEGAGAGAGAGSGGPSGAREGTAAHAGRRALTGINGAAVPVNAANA